MNFLSSNSFDVTQLGLDYSWRKMESVQENIANLDTPGYKAKKVSFENELVNNMRNIRNAKKSDISDAIFSTNIKVEEDDAASLRLDGNNVNFDAESIELARTQIQYQYLVRQYSSEHTRLKGVIAGNG